MEFIYRTSDFDALYIYIYVYRYITFYMSSMLENAKIKFYAFQCFFLKSV